MAEVRSLLSPLVCPCRFARLPAHHEQLMRAADDLTATVELLELAVTWEELDYSEEAVIPPADWLEFLDAHRWNDREAAERVFRVALDVARRRAPIRQGACS